MLQDFFNLMFLRQATPFHQSTYNIVEVARSYWKFRYGVVPIALSLLLGGNCKIVLTTGNILRSCLVKNVG